MMYWINCENKETPKEIKNKHFNVRGEAEEFRNKLQQDEKYKGFIFKIYSADSTISPFTRK